MFVITTKDIDQIIGTDIYGIDDQKIGSAGQVYLDDESGQPEWVTVKTGLFGMKESFVPLAEADWSGSRLKVPYDKNMVKDAPRIDADAELDLNEEQQLYSYYGTSQEQMRANVGGRYDTAGGRTPAGKNMPAGTAGTAAAGTAAAGAAGGYAGTRAGQEGQRSSAGTAAADYGQPGTLAGQEAKHGYAGTSARTSATGTSTGTSATGTSATGTSAGTSARGGAAGYGDATTRAGQEVRQGADAMTRSEERVRAGTRSEEVGKARLRKHIVTEQQQITVPVSHEEVRVERESITEANRGEAMAGSELTEQEYEVTLHADKAVVTKETVPVERVRLDTETVTEQETVVTEVRKEQIDVETDVQPGRKSTGRDDRPRR